MNNVKGWDTIGVTNCGALRDGRMNLTFTGKDGDTRNIFIPRDSLGQLIPSLLAMNAAMAKEEGTHDMLSGTHLIGIKRIQIGADEDGQEFGLELVTNDNLEIRYTLDRQTTESLATGLVATLAKHGIRIQLHPPEGLPKH